MQKKMAFSRLLLLTAAFPSLTVWILVRLFVPLGGGVSGVLLAGVALAAAGGICALVRLCLRHVPRCLTAFCALPSAVQCFLLAAAFLLGGLFDVSYSMRNMDGSFLARPFLRLLCHCGNAFVFTGIVLFLTASLLDMRGVGKIPLWQFGLLTAVVIGVTCFYIRTSKTVYVWDVAGYWTVAQQLAKQPLHYWHIRNILATTITLDYNHLLAFPISLVMRLFGDSHAVFLWASSLLYVLPGVWALCVLGKQHKGGGILLFALFPMFLYTSLTGFVDVAPASLSLWAFVIYFSDRPLVSRGILTGALLVSTFLLRRYFFFFCVSFCAAALISQLIFRRERWSSLLALFCSCTVCTLTFAYSFVLEKVVASDYRNLYSAYTLGLSADGKLVCFYFGFCFLLALLALVMMGFLQNRERQKLAFCLFQIVICFFAFLTVQSHGQQHLLLYFPALVLLTALTLPNIRKWNAAPAVLSGVMLFNCFLPKVKPSSPAALRASHLFLPGFTFYGVQRADIDQLIALSDFLNSLSTAEEPRTAVVMASSFDFNCETLLHLRASLRLPEPEVQTVIQYHGTVDKRDAFNWNSPSADYMMVGDPVQVHLGEENQALVSLLAHDLLDGVGPGRNYIALPETFSLQNGAVIRIYQRVSDWSYDDYRSISDRLTARYPDYAELYQLPDWIVP